MLVGVDPVVQKIRVHPKGLLGGHPKGLFLKYIYFERNLCSKMVFENRILKIDLKSCLNRFEYKIHIKCRPIRLGIDPCPTRDFWTSGPPR